MSKKYVVLNSDNTLNAFYADDIHDIPSDAIEISGDLHQQYFTFSAHKKVLVNGQWIEGKPQEEIEAEQLLASLQPTPQELADADLEIKMLTLLMEMEVI